MCVYNICVYRLWPTIGIGATKGDGGDVLDLINAKGGILDLLNEAVALPKATDASYSDNVKRVHAAHERLVVPKYPKPVFGIRHFASRDLPDWELALRLVVCDPLWRS